jgi:hypothetical protein
VTVFCLAPEQTDALWDEYAHHLERLEKRGDCLSSAIREDLKLARKQLWGYQQDGRILGVAITSVMETPRGRALEIYGAAGTESVRGQLDEMMVEIKRWAAAIGCARIRILGRRGWLRRINGLKQTGLVMEMEL